MKKILLLVLACLLPAALFAENAEWYSRVLAVSSEQEGLKLVNEIKASSLTQGEKDLYTGIVYHNLIDLNAGVYLEPALSLLEKVSGSSPLGLGYYGSALTKQGGIAASNKKVLAASGLVKDGFKTIDKALEKDPDNINLRILRMYNALEVGRDSPFKRYETVREDLAWMKKRLSGLPAGTQAVYYFITGELAWLENDIDTALDCFDRVIDIAPKSSEAAAAREYLSLLED